MNGLFHNALQILMALVYLLLFAISVIILKPFRIHRKRPYTTISLKTSYLLFLIIYLVFTFLLLFGAKEVSINGMPYEKLFNIHFLFFLSATIIPNVGVMIRRKITKYRVEYNIISTIVNLLYFAYLVFAIYSKKWAIL